MLLNGGAVVRGGDVSHAAVRTQPLAAVTRSLPADDSISAISNQPLPTRRQPPASGCHQQQFSFSSSLLAVSANTNIGNVICRTTRRGRDHPYRHQCVHPTIGKGAHPFPRAFRAACPTTRRAEKADAQKPVLRPAHAKFTREH